MKLKLALPVLGALALFAALPAEAEARRRSSFDVSVGFGSSHYSGYRGYRGYGGGHHDSSVSFRYSRGRDYGYHGSRYRNYNHGPRYYNHHHHRPIYRSERYYYRPVRRVYRDYDYDYGYYRRPVVRRYYYRDYDYCY